ncbi:MAG TPA: phosphoglycolate phosphatase [Terriglobales bacterium]|nr:phosphoglycolate phosphatase [Terriglobales bacterium]
MMMTRYSVLVCDYDGTLALGDFAAAEVVDALRCVAESGTKLILATGRELPEIQQVFPDLGIFQWVVAENGAILYQPSRALKEVLGSAPPETFFDELRKENIGPVARGEVVAAIDSKHAAALKRTVQSLYLPYQVILNKNSAMVLPAGIDKGTGVKAVLQKFGISCREVVAVGDGENDVDLFRIAGYRVAVANAVPELQEAADMVTTAANGRGVMEMIELLFASTPMMSENKGAVNADL